MALSPMYDPDTVVLMRQTVEKVCERFAPDCQHLELAQLIAARERIAIAVLYYSNMGIRDPLVLRAMGLAAVKIPEEA